MEFDDKLAQEIADRLRKGEVVVVADTERNHAGRTYQLLRDTLDDDATATFTRVTLPSGGLMLLKPVSPTSLEGLRFNLALVNAATLPLGDRGDHIMRILRRSAAKSRDGAEVGLF